MFGTQSFSTIKGLQPSFPELGRIKIGMLGPERTSKHGNKYRMPDKLDHFRVTTRVRDSQGQFALDEEVHRAIGMPTPGTATTAASPTMLGVTLLYDDPTLNCPARLNCYQGSRRWCHGNGEQALRMDAHGIYRERQCPCALLSAPESAEENRGKLPNDLLRCRPNGSLGVQLPYKKTSVGIYRFRTTSVESIQSILTVQGAILMRTGGVLGGIPLRLRIYPATDNTPGGASQSWKVTLDLPDGGWEAIDQAARDIVQARAASRLGLKAIEARARQQMRALNAAGPETEALIDELFPKPLTEINGVQVIDEPEDDDQYPSAMPAPPEAQEVEQEETTSPTPESKPDPQPGIPFDAPPVPDPIPDTPEPDQDEMAFQTAYDSEDGCGTPEAKQAAVDAQLEALRRLMKRKGYQQAMLKKTIEKFGRSERSGFFRHLLAMPDTKGGRP